MNSMDTVQAHGLSGRVNAMGSRGSLTFATKGAGILIKPSRAEPSRAEPSRAEPSRAEPSRAVTLTGGRPDPFSHLASACRCRLRKRLPLPSSPERSRTEPGSPASACRRPRGGLCVSALRHALLPALTYRAVAGLVSAEGRCVSAHFSHCAELPDSLSSWVAPRQPVELAASEVARSTRDCRLWRLDCANEAIRTL